MFFHTRQASSDTQSMNRTTFLIDGFNLYHSLKKASNDNQNAQTRWLNLTALCSSYLYIVGQKTGQRATLANIHFFSALVDHLATQANPGIVNRQKLYLRCLEDNGVQVELGRFKKKYIRCHTCGATNLHHEEKETDVAIGARLLELFINNKCDSVVIITGDTDIAAAVKIAQKLYPAKHILFGFPYARKNAELAKLAPSFTITDTAYVKHQFPNHVTLKNGKSISKPAKW